MCFQSSKEMPLTALNLLAILKKNGAHIIKTKFTDNTKTVNPKFRSHFLSPKKRSSYREYSFLKSFWHEKINSVEKENLAQSYFDWCDAMSFFSGLNAKKITNCLNKWHWRYPFHVVIGMYFFKCKYLVSFVKYGQIKHH